jgi:hypothetical protein
MLNVLTQRALYCLEIATNKYAMRQQNHMGKKPSRAQICQKKLPKRQNQAKLSSSIEEAVQLSNVTRLSRKNQLKIWWMK